MDPLVTPPGARHQHRWRQNVSGAWWECEVPGCDAVITELERVMAGAGRVIDSAFEARKPESGLKPLNNAQLDAMAQPRVLFRGPDINRAGYRKLVARKKGKRRRKRLKRPLNTG
jgi:hypothetical protein